MSNVFSFQFIGLDSEDHKMISYITYFVIISIYNIGSVQEKDEKLFLLLLAMRRLYINMPMVINDINTIRIPPIAPSTIGVNIFCTSSLLKSDVFSELTVRIKYV